MNQLLDYIKVYDDVLDENICQNLIDTFETFNPQKSPFYRQSKNSWDLDYRQFYEFDIARVVEFNHFINPVYNVAKNIFARYNRECGRFFPEKMGFEDLRIKRYDANGIDQFGWHADVGNYASARRFLVMFFYLNDVEEGGETEFQFSGDYSKVPDFTVKPKRGRIVVFPPMWMFPHRGCMPISGSKYILSTYAHYQ